MFFHALHYGQEECNTLRQRAQEAPVVFPGAYGVLICSTSPVASCIPPTGKDVRQPSPTSRNRTGSTTDARGVFPREMPNRSQQKGGMLFPFAGGTCPGLMIWPAFETSPSAKRFPNMFHAGAAQQEEYSMLGHEHQTVEFQPRSRWAVIRSCLCLVPPNEQAAMMPEDR